MLADVISRDSSWYLCDLLTTMSDPGEAPSVIRAFVSVPVPEVVRLKLRDTIALLRRSDAHVSWVRPRNLHISLVFLGDTFRGG